ncbi:hypothetical protein BC829DRAFT_443671 [Chytridium lagenaria]|nr:hypothetical protein BC829DRAFT_443671 [Chytridium lagenaria]
MHLIQTVGPARLLVTNAQNFAPGVARRTGLPPEPGKVLGVFGLSIHTKKGIWRIFLVVTEE